MAGKYNKSASGNCEQVASRSGRIDLGRTGRISNSRDAWSKPVKANSTWDVSQMNVRSRSGPVAENPRGRAGERDHY